MSSVTFDFQKSNSSPISRNILSSNLNFMVISDRAYFYNEPNEETRRGYLVQDKSSCWFKGREWLCIYRFYQAQQIKIVRLDSDQWYFFSIKTATSKSMRNWGGRVNSTYRYLSLAFGRTVLNRQRFLYALLHWL